MKRMVRLGLTGSIATGKSTVLNHFASLGIPVFSADAAVHEFYAGPANDAVETLFPGVVHDGVVDRSRLSAALLAEPHKIRALEDEIHPLVRRRIAEFLVEAEMRGAKLAVVDIPLLFESAYDYGLDKVAVTFCTPELQRRRALARQGMTVEKLDAILARQMPQEEKKARADFTIDTSGALADTYAAVEAIVATLNGPK